MTKSRLIFFWSVLVAIHLACVLSILLQKRSIIWPLHNDTIHRLGPSADFYAVYHAAINVRRGADPYDNKPDGVTPYWNPFRYLPAAAYAAAPLTILSPQVAWQVWTLLLEVLLAILLVTLWQQTADKRVGLMAGALLLVNSPYFLEVYMGQFTFAAIALCCLSLFIKWGQPLYCGSVLLKPLTVAALPALVRERQFWGHAISAIVCVALLTIPYFLRYPDRGDVFMEANFHLVGGLDTGNYGFVRLVNLVASNCRISFVLEHWSDWIWIFRYGLLTAVAWLVLFAKRKVIAASVAALLLAHFLTYQHVWEHQMSGVCVLGALLLTVPQQPKWFTVTVLVSLLILALPTPFVLLDSAKEMRVWDPSKEWPWYGVYLLVLPKAAPTLALFICAVAYVGGAGLTGISGVGREAAAKSGRTSKTHRRARTNR